MSESKTQLKRAAKSASRPIRVRLSQINADKQQEFCHRDARALDAATLAPLVENLVSEGQQTPLTVYDSGRTDAAGRTMYILVGGFRRYHSLHKAAADNLDAAHIHAEMEVDAVEVVKGAGQDDAEFRKDLLVRSVGENEQRKNFTNDEKLAIVKQFHAAKVPAPRAASALGVSETQYQRFLSIVSHPWLHDLVTGQCVGSTDAAELAQKGEKHGRLDDLRGELTRWVAARRKQLDAERRELAKVGKKLTGAAATVKKYLDRKLVKHWLDCIEQGRPFAGKPEFNFGILIDPEKKTITVPGRVFRADELTVADFETMIAELQEATGELIPLLRQRRVAEAARDVSDEERERELARILADRRRRKEEQRRAEAGRPADDFHAADAPDEEDIDTDDETAGEEDRA
jgi:hypothetical protein